MLCVTSANRGKRLYMMMCWRWCLCAALYHQNIHILHTVNIQHIHTHNTTLDTHAAHIHWVHGISFVVMMCHSVCEMHAKCRPIRKFSCKQKEHSEAHKKKPQKKALERSCKAYYHATIGALYHNTWFNTENPHGKTYPSKTQRGRTAGFCCHL